MPRLLMASALGALAMLAGLVLAPRPTFADQRDFTFLNSGQTTITEVYVAPSDSDDWGDDILGRDVLNPGESVFIRFLRYEPGQCLYDISVVGKDGAEGTLTRVNLCATETVTFSL